MSKLPYFNKSEINIQELNRYLNSNMRDDRIKAIHYLTESRIESAVSNLRKLIELDPDPIVREVAIVALSKFQFDDYIEFFTKITRGTIERNNFVRARAVWAVGRIDSPQVYNVLIKGIREDHAEIQHWSIVGLLHQKKSTIPIQELGELLKKTNNHFIRQTIVWVLGNTGQTAAVKLLTDVIIKDKNAQVRLTATWALRRINDIGSISGLVYALKNELNELAKRELAITIGSILDSTENLEVNTFESSVNTRKEAIRVISLVLQRDTCYYVRRACAETLAKINDIEALPVLINTYASDVNQFVRSEIAHTLGILGDIRALPVLKKSLRSHYKRVVFAAQEAIKRIQQNGGKN